MTSEGYRVDREGRIKTVLIQRWAGGFVFLAENGGVKKCSVTNPTFSYHRTLLDASSVATSRLRDRLHEAVKQLVDIQRVFYAIPLLSTRGDDKPEG